MTVLMGLAILGGIVLISLLVYLVVRLGSYAYFRSLKEHQEQLSYAYWKKTLGFNRRKVPREAEK